MLARKETKRIIFIGDVHGCLWELKGLVNKLDFDPLFDRLILLGDLVDRGPLSAACVKYVRELGVECIRGNHDDKHSRFHGHTVKVAESIARGDRKRYKHPMSFDEARLVTQRSLSDEDFEWLGSLPGAIFVDELNLLAVHGGVEPRKHPLEQSDRLYMRIRYVDVDTGRMVKLPEDFSQPTNSANWTDVYNGDVNIIYGHDVVDLKTPRIQYNSRGAFTIGVDTGCVFGGRLTACVFALPSGTMKIAQVKSYHAYENRHPSALL